MCRIYVMQEKELKGFVIVTGASSGIGQAIATLFAKQGYNLLLLARRIEKLEAMNLPNTICASVDVTNLSDVCVAIDKATLQFGHVICLINNAGIMFSDRVEKLEPSKLHNMLNTNIIGAYNCMYAVIETLKNQRSGTIINVGSVASKKAVPLLSGYCASKFGLLGLSESIRLELAECDVRVMSLLPGYVETELYDGIDDKNIKSENEKWKKALDKVLLPEDVAQFVLSCYQLPQHVCIREATISPTRQLL